MYARHIARSIARSRVRSSEVLLWRAAASCLLQHHSLAAIDGSSFSVRMLSQPRHTYATRSTAADSYLVEVLKSEIEHELHEEANKKGSLKGSSGPFELVDKAGTEEVVLKRTFGNEQIGVTCLVESQYPDRDVEADQEENENDDEPQTRPQSRPVEVLRLTVTITKDAPSPALEFECTYVRGSDEIDISSLNYLKEEKEETTEIKEDNDEPQPYTGPDFDDLDENLQRAFHDLLKARGLSPKIASHVLDYITVKEHREYMRWLHNVETFFSS